VFVVGAARSGTSVLYRTLLQHPAFAIGTPDFTESFAVTALTMYRDIGDRLANVQGFMGHDDAAWDQFTRTVAPVRRWRRLLWPVVGRWVGRRPVWRALGSAIVLRTYFDFAARGRRVGRVVEKTPVNLTFTPLIRSAFPNGRMIVIIRHPVDVLGSYWRRHATDANATWADISINEFCATWRAEAEMADDFRRRWPDAFLVVRYEDFTGDPDREFARICAFVGEPMAADALRGRHDDYWSAEPLLYEDIKPSAQGREQFIPAEVAADVSARLAAPMRLFDYAPQPAPSADGDRQ